MDKRIRWSFLWIVLHHTQPDLSESKDPSLLVLVKNSPHYYNKSFSELSLRLPSYEPVATCLKELTELVTKAYTVHLNTANSDPSQSGSDFDDSDITGGGSITYETFSAIFASVCSGVQSP